MGMEVPDGRVLVENIFVGPQLLKHKISDIKRWPGLFDEEQISNQYARELFNMSSRLPQSYAAALNDSFDLRPGSRMLYPVDNTALLQLAFAVSGATGRGRR